MKRAARGAAAGVVATGVMSLLMVAARRAGLMGRMPPEKITARLLRSAGLPHGRRTQDAAATALHFGFGAGAGALFGATVRRSRLPPVLAGSVFGAGVWLVSYMGWVPALGIMPPPQDDRPGRPQSMLLAHLVYGGVLGALSGR